MIRLTSLALVASSLLLFSACDTVQTAPQRGGDKIETASVVPVPAGRGSHEDGGIVLAYDFTDKSGAHLDETGKCRLRFLESTTRRSYFMNIDREKRSAFVGLPPGNYDTGRMGCGLTKVWDLGDMLHGPIKVEAGSASYAGKVSFIFVNGDLQVVEKAARGRHAEGFRDAESAVPSGMKIVSGYSLIPLTEEMANEGTSASGFDLQAQGIASGPILNGLLAQLRKCENTGSKDPLHFGRLDYTATYAKGRFTGFKNRRDVNAFNEEFKACITNTLSSFSPPASAKEVEIHLVY